LGSRLPLALRKLGKRAKAPGKLQNTGVFGGWFGPMAQRRDSGQEYTSWHGKMGAFFIPPNRNAPKVFIVTSL
jgi:hypothetical protein